VVITPFFFFSGASESGAAPPTGFSGRLTHPPLYAYSGFSDGSVAPPSTGFGGRNTLPPYYAFSGFSEVGSTPSPTVQVDAVTTAPLAGGGYHGIQDRYWREREKLYERKKRAAKKRSKRAVEIVEELARQELALSEAVAKLHEELAAANVQNQEMYVELLKLKLEIVEEEEADDFLLLH
jgi:hypothetical protein